MKDILKTLFLCIVVCFITIGICKINSDKKHIPEKTSTDMLIFGDDTIVVMGAQIIDCSKLNNFLMVSYYDSLSEITYTEINLNRDSFYLKVDSTWILHYKGIAEISDSAFDLKIEAQNGDIITGNAVKNVYNTNQ